MTMNKKGNRHRYQKQESVQPCILQKGTRGKATQNEKAEKKRRVKDGGVRSERGQHLLRAHTEFQIKTVDKV